MAGIGGGHLPLVVQFMQVFVHALQVQEAVNPVDAHVGEQNERHHTADDAKPAYRR